MARAHSLVLDFDEALAAIDRAIESAPERAYYQARKALLLLQMERVDDASGAMEKACCMSPDNPFDADLMIAFDMLNEDRTELEQVARGETRRSYTPEQRGQAFIALGDYREALRQYEAATLDMGRELIDLITDDWIWRCPHIINRAHLWLREGDPRGEKALRSLLDELEIIESQDIVNPLAHYWTACAYTLLQREQEARESMSEARRTGWHHPWWESRDWNLKPPG
jgi:tetratricopeptide (TPR) repeat protein